MEQEHSFDRGAVNQFTDVVKTCVENNKRTINLCSMTLEDDNGKPMRLVVTMVCEPAVFGETIYPDDAPFSSSVISQLKKFEEVS